MKRGWTRAVAGCGVLATMAATAWGQAESTTQAAAVAVMEEARGKETRSYLDELRFDDLFRHNRLQNWVVLLVAIFVAMAAGRVAAFVLQRIAARLEKRKWHSQAEVFSGLASPASLAIFTLGLSVGVAQLAVSPLLADLDKRVLLLLYTVSAFWYAFNLVSVLEVALQKFTARTETKLDDDLVPVIRKTLRVFIVVIGALFILQNVFDRDIGAWLAGLGIAGLAVSLAAQDSLKNLFGSLTILFDRPFSHGQRIKFHNIDGKVEQIGFRSTKVRTGDGSLVTIPNSNIVNDPVDNWQARPSIRRVLNVTITYDTPVAKVREAVGIIRGLFEAEEFREAIYDRDPLTNADPPRAFFDELNADSLNIKVYYWYRPADWWGYLEFTERFNLRLMEAYEQAGIEFAFPTRMLFLADDPKRKLRMALERAEGEPPQDQSSTGA